MALLKSIITVGGFTIISRITGFVRDVLIARFLGASTVADAFFIALKLPNLFRSLFAEGAFNSAFIPLFTEELEKNGHDAAKAFAKEIFSALLYILALFTAVMELIMPLAVMLIAPGFLEVPNKVELTSEMCRITFPFLLLVSLNCMQGGILNSLGKFAAPAFTSTILNLSMIAALLWLTPFLSGADASAFALCWGVFAAGFIQFFFLLYHLKRQDMILHLVSPFKVFFRMAPQTKTLLKRILPATVGAGIYQINLLIDTFFVSFLASGAVSWIYYANRLFQLPVGVLGAAIGTALLPMLTRHIKVGSIGKERATLSRALEFAVFTSFPAAVGLIVLDRVIIGALFEYGEFTHEETLRTASALSAFALGLPAYVISKSLLPCFFARGDTKSPVRVAAISLIINIILCYTFIRYWGHTGIALATSVTAWINLYQYYFMLKRRDFLHVDYKFCYRVPRILIAALVMGIGLQACFYASEIIVPGWVEMSGYIRICILSSLICAGILIFCLATVITKAFKIKDLKKILSGQT